MCPRKLLNIAQVLVKPDQLLVNLMTPLVSILIPTYNRASFLREAIRSAVAQTHRNLEILVLDDASPDETAAVAAGFAQDLRVQYIRHQENLGITGNWRAGIQIAQGEYFCFLHDDDTFEPSFIEKLVAPMQDDLSLILAFSDHWVTDAEGNRLADASDAASQRFGRTHLQEGRLLDFASSALVNKSLPVGATLFRKSMVSSKFVAEQAKGAIDAWLFYQCVKSGHTGYYIPERLMNYRTHSGGMSASMPLYMAEGHLFRYKSILADNDLTRIHVSIKQQMAETLTAQGVSLLVSGRRKESRKSLGKSLKINPSSRAAIAYGLACAGSAGTRIATALRR